MIAAAANAVAELANPIRPGHPCFHDGRPAHRVATVAIAVAATATRDGVAHPLDNPVQQVFDAMWTSVTQDIIDA